MVNVTDEEAAEFWRRRGFLPSKDDSLVFIRSLPTSPHRWPKNESYTVGNVHHAV